eukprot:scaffold389202_cov47-Prasinocladus_malaysianus.AAC.1
MISPVRVQLGVWDGATPRCTSTSKEYQYTSRAIEWYVQWSDVFNQNRNTGISAVNPCFSDIS